MTSARFFVRIFTDQGVCKPVGKILEADLFGEADMLFEKIVKSEKDLLHVLYQSRPGMVVFRPYECSYKGRPVGYKLFFRCRSHHISVA